MRLEVAAILLTAAGVHVFEMDKGYLVGALLAMLVACGYYKRSGGRWRGHARVWGLLINLVFIFVSGAFLAPLLADMEVLRWIPRPEPLSFQWRVLSALVAGVVGGAMLEPFLSRLSRRGAAGSRELADTVADRLHLPKVPDSDVLPDVSKMTAEQFEAFIESLPPEILQRIREKQRRKPQ